MNPFQFEKFSEERLNYMASFDVEKWYDSINEFTFRTIFIPLSIEQATALVNHYQQFQNSKQGVYTLKNEESIAELVNTLDLGIKSLGCHSFVRLSTRSPKDAAQSSVQTVSKEFDRLAAERAGKTECEDERARCNDLLRAIYKTSIEAMRISSGKEAVELLLKSERIFVDLVKAIPVDHWDMKIILREFSQGLNPELEFRSFAVGRKLTAISQYNDILYYPFMKDREVRKRIVTSICSYWEKASKCVDYEYCVVDFVLKSVGSGEVKIIEINPFGTMTGPSLFQWEYDRSILQGGLDLFGDLKDCKPFPLNSGIIEERFEEFPDTTLRVRGEIPERTDSELIGVLHPDMQSLLSREQSRKGEKTCMLM
eukprot:TRINITY_DN4738_c0_g1_i1.p1 TRINITY_DN4738_c0_g1~~TRINITY_DN4738_c0_g1_i1.p1  ORF type:complete len:369 (+),score=80.02 TRINITY_DN4738_c0_g1_i1:44-1150(+)